MQKQNNLLNEILLCKEMVNSSDGSALQTHLEGLHSYPGKISFWNPGWNINTFTFNKNMFLKRMGKHIKVTGRNVGTL